MSKPRDDRQKDLLLPALDQIIDMGHPLVRLAALIDWNILDDRFSSVCQTESGQPGLPTRLVAGLFILKHMHNLSDEVLCARWIENPYYQYFCGELSFCHRLPFDRSSMTRWRQRLGEEQLVALIQESLSISRASVGCATALGCTVVSTITRSRSLGPIAPVLCAQAQPFFAHWPVLRGVTAGR
jgi:IS5 family transposase